MNKIQYFGSSRETFPGFMDDLRRLKEEGKLHCVTELRLRVGYEEEVWGFGVNGIVEWTRISAQSDSDFTSTAVVRGDGWQWEIESIEWLGASEGTFQFAGYFMVDGKLERVRLLWQIIW